MANGVSPHKGHLGNDAQDPQEDSQNSDSPTIYATPQNQGRLSAFEYSSTTLVPSRTSVIWNLNLDFPNLRLADVRTPIDQHFQIQHLTPRRCNEYTLDMGWCSNTTETVDEIRPCHGRHHDGLGLRGRLDQWIEPKNLYKHVRLVQTADRNDEAYYDSFNVCTVCHEHHRLLRAPYENVMIRGFAQTCCQTHSLEFLQQRPYNACRCKAFLEKYWRCDACSLVTLEELSFRALTFGDVPYPTFIFDEKTQTYIDRRNGTTRRHVGCPVLGCTGSQWLSGPLRSQMRMCRACTAIFPRLS